MCMGYHASTVRLHPNSKRRPTLVTWANPMRCLFQSNFVNTFLFALDSNEELNFIPLATRVPSLASDPGGTPTRFRRHSWFSSFLHSFSWMATVPMTYDTFSSDTASVLMTFFYLSSILKRLLWHSLEDCKLKLAVMAYTYVYPGTILVQAARAFQGPLI
jgi:hypothetical protein